MLNVDHVRGESAVRQAGRLFCFEGVDGSGKSTQVSLLSARLAEHGVPHSVFVSPGGSPLADEVRRLVLGNNLTIGEPASEGLLHLAAIFETMRTRVLPRLEANEVVLLDRFVFSTAAYQGGHDPALRRWILEVASSWIDLRVVTRAFFLQVEPTLAKRRMDATLKATDRYDGLPVKTKELIGAAFVSIAQEFSDIFTVVDAHRDPNVLAGEIWESVRRSLCAPERGRCDL